MAKKVKNVFVSDEEAADFEYVADIYRSIDSTVMYRSYELGEAVNRTIENASKNKEKYSNKTIETFAEKLDCNPATLYNAARVYRAFSDENFRALADLQHEDGWKLKWTHFVYLAHQSVAKQRQKLGERAFRERWTTSKLFDQLKSNKDKNDKRGREPKLVPKTIGDCLSTISSQALHIIDLADTNWFGDKFNIIERLRDEPIDAISEELLGDINQAIADMRSVTSTFMTYTDDMVRLVKELIAKKEADPPTVLYPGEEGESTPVADKSPKPSSRSKRKAGKRRTPVGA